MHVIYTQVPARPGYETWDTAVLLPAHSALQLAGGVSTTAPAKPSLPGRRLLEPGEPIAARTRQDWSRYLTRSFGHNIGIDRGAGAGDETGKNAFAFERLALQQGNKRQHPRTDTVCRRDTGAEKNKAGKADRKFPWGRNCK